MKRTTTCLISILLLISVFAVSTAFDVYVAPVSAHSGDVLGPAWATVAPTIDGQIGITEWADADTESFMLPSNLTGTLYIMNDAENLYVGLTINDPDFSDEDEFRISFDNDHDGVLEKGDDSLYYSGTKGFNDDFYEEVIARDWVSGGTDDGQGAASRPAGRRNHFEMSHPLDSADNAHDFSLSLGDTVGFTLAYADEGDTLVGNEWPGPLYGPADEWGDINIACPPLSWPSITVTQLGVTYKVDAIQRAESAVDFYDFYSASGHTPFMEDLVSKIYVYRDTTTDELSLIMHHSIDDSVSNYMVEDFDLTGVPACAYTALSDDPTNEFDLAQEPEGQWGHSYNSDGGIVGGLPMNSSWCITVYPDFKTGLIGWQYQTPMGVKNIKLSMEHPVTICYRPRGRILIDESHDNRGPSPAGNWTEAEAFLESNGYIVEYHLMGPITSAVLSRFDVLLIAAPFNSYSKDEIEIICSFVSSGHGVFMIGEWCDYWTNYGNHRGADNLNDISTIFGIKFNHNTVHDPTDYQVYTHWPIIHELHPEHPVTRCIFSFQIFAGCSLSLRSPAIPLAWGDDDTYAEWCELPQTPSTGSGGETLSTGIQVARPGEPIILLAASCYGTGRVVAFSEPNAFDGDDGDGDGSLDLYDCDNEWLLLRIMHWLSTWLLGDVDGDCDVDHKDLLLLAAAYGSKIGQPNYNPNADFDCSGTIDHKDLLILAANYGKSL